MAGALQHSGSISKPLVMYGADGTGTLASPSNQLVTSWSSVSLCPPVYL